MLSRLFNSCSGGEASSAASFQDGFAIVGDEKTKSSEQSKRRTMTAYVAFGLAVYDKGKARKVKEKPSKLDLSQGQAERTDSAKDFEEKYRRSME
jgi:hypothetical protein